jgi:2-hydroxy-6-oxonona-2,4-dienedioate hydrolase
MSAKARRMRSHIALAALACLLVGGQAHAQVGPNGEIDGLTAKFVDVNGVRTRYYDYGQGEAIVLAHGGEPYGPSSSANTWSRNIRSLARKFRVLAVDRLAQGMTGNPKDDGDFSIQGEAEHMYQFIRAMKLDKVHLVGSSSGGAVMFRLALEHPEIVKTFTAVDSGPSGASVPTSPGPTRLDALLAKCPPDRTSDEFGKCRTLSLAYSPDTVPPDFLKAQLWMRNLPKAVEARKRWTAIRAEPQRQAEERAYRERIAEKARSGALQVPILIYGGKQDPLHWGADEPHALRMELDFFDIVGAKNPRVKCIIVNKAGHLPHQEQPEQFNADLIQFIEFWNSNPKASESAAR